LARLLGSPFLALFRVIKRYVANLQPVPCADALGHTTAATHWRAAGHEHPQYVIAALAYVAEARKPMLGSSEQFR
jgi:hypothetical protein